VIGLAEHRHKGGQQNVVVQHLYPGAQAVGVVNKGVTWGMWPRTRIFRLPFYVNA
jgi:hypothetical protein